MLATSRPITEMHHRLTPPYSAYSAAVSGGGGAYALPAAGTRPPPPPRSTVAARGASPIEMRKLEAEVCRRFVQVSCAKMHASRQSRSGARLHKNLLILRLLAKARNNVAVLPYECGSLLRRKHEVNYSLPYISNVELPSQTQFSNNTIDLNGTYNQNTQSNDIIIDDEVQSHTSEVEDNNDKNNSIGDVYEEEENFSMDISYINERVNNDQEIRLSCENAGNYNQSDIRADAEIASVMASTAEQAVADTQMDCSVAVPDFERKKAMFSESHQRSNDVWMGAENNDGNSTQGRLYERISRADAEQNPPLFGSTHSGSDKKGEEPSSAAVVSARTGLHAAWSGPRLLLSSSLSSSSPFELVGEIPSLQSVICNPVSPPLGTISDQLAGFPAYAAAAEDPAKSTYFGDFQEHDVNECDDTICDCDGDVMVAADGVLYRRKRKTSGNIAVCQKRHCCDEHNLGEDSEVLERLDCSAADGSGRDYCRKCGGQILRRPYSLCGEELCSRSVDDGAAMLVPDIDNQLSLASATPASGNDPEFEDQFVGHNFSAWLIAGVKTQQKQQQCYSYQQQQHFYRSATIYGNNTINNNTNNDIFDSNNSHNNNYVKIEQQRYQQQHRETGSGTTVWDQVVPMAGGGAHRLRGHFVGPLVGLVAETPYILMF